MKRLTTVRARTTFLALAVFAVALVLSSLGLFSVLRRTMIENVDLALELRARDVAALVESGTPPESISIEDETDGFYQFIADGSVVAASFNVEGEGPILVGQPDVVTMQVDAVDEARFRVETLELVSPDGPLTLTIGTTLEDVDETLDNASGVLMVGIPSLLGLAGLLTWFAIGRGLRPVEAIRAEVAEIGATDLHRRVPQPKTDDEIGRLAVTMNEMLDRIEAGTLRQKQFVSDASHELRTPIAIIRHELEVALQHRESAEWTTIAEEVLEEDLRMQRLVDDLLWLARHDDDNRATVRQLVDLDEIVMAHAKRTHAGHRVAIDTAAVGAGQVRGYPDDLTRVVQNLLNNALFHARTSVRLTVGSDGAGQVVLQVEDDGPGVPVEVRTSILERFARGDEARTRDSGGAGLGLAIVNEIVEEHGALLTITDSDLGGARFTVSLTDARVS